jgi:hypothetical protein
VEHLLLCPVDDLAGALADLHGHGLRVAGSEADAPLTARQSDLRGPLAIVVGSEGQGLGPTVRRRCDLFMRIPMRGAVASLNAAVAGSVLLFEAVAQRDPEGRRGPSDATPWPTPRRRSGGGADTPLATDAERPGEALPDAEATPEAGVRETAVATPEAALAAAAAVPSGIAPGAPLVGAPPDAPAEAAQADLLPGPSAVATPKPKRARTTRKA